MTHYATLTLWDVTRIEVGSNSICFGGGTYAWKNHDVSCSDNPKVETNNDLYGQREF